MKKADSNSIIRANILFKQKIKQLYEEREKEVIKAINKSCDRDFKNWLKQ